MKRKGPTVELRALRKFVAEVETKFIAPHVRHRRTPAMGTPSRDEVLDVAAFVVLVHGAFENFVEGIGLWALEELERSWTYKKRLSRCSASLLLYHTTSRQDFEAPRTVYENIRLAISEAKSSVSADIEQNNGIAMRHLRGMFTPLGIDVPDDLALSAAVDLLVTLRHEWAHQYRYGAKKVKFASEVKKTVDDCLVLAQRLADGARSIRP